MRYRRLNGPLSIQVEVTEACNLSCVHCYNHWRDVSSQNCVLHLDEAKLNLIADLIIDMKVASVTITGGEPLIFWKILPHAIKRLIDAGVSVGFNSNLTLLDEENVIVLKSSGLKHFLVSVLCGKEEIHDLIVGQKGAWKSTIRGIQLAKEHGFKISSNMVLTKLNFKYLRETAEFLKKIGVSTFCATKASPSLGTRNFDEQLLSRDELKISLKELIQIKEDLGMNVDILECYPLCLIGDVSKFEAFAQRSCRAGITSCTIGPTGDVRPCSHADMIYGNVFCESFQEIWARMDDWRDCRYVPNECNSCRFIERCSGGCRMEAKHRGDICGKDPFMSCPEDVQFPVPLEHELQLPHHKNFYIDKSLRIRKEDFGATIFSPKGSVLVNEDGLRIVQGLTAENIFTVNLVATRFLIPPDDAYKFLSDLMNRGIVHSAR